MTVVQNHDKIVRCYASHVVTVGAWTGMWYTREAVKVVELVFFQTFLNSAVGMSSTKSIFSLPSLVVSAWLATSRGSALASSALSHTSLSAFSLAISSSSWSRDSSSLSRHFWMSSHLFSSRVLLSCWFHLKQPN